jgi:hypothetical protein
VRRVAFRRRIEKGALMNQFQADLIAVYKNVMREVEGGSADFDELNAW